MTSCGKSFKSSSRCPFCFGLRGFFNAESTTACGEDYNLRWKDRGGAEIRASDGGGSVNRIWIWEDTRSRFQELEALIQEKNDTREILTNFINKLEDLTGKQTEFREELWGGLVDHIRIDEKSSTVVFRGGIEITI